MEGKAANVHAVLHFVRLCHNDNLLPRCFFLCPAYCKFLAVNFSLFFLCLSSLTCFELNFSYLFLLCVILHSSISSPFCFPASNTLKTFSLSLSLSDFVPIIFLFCFVCAVLSQTWYKRPVSFTLSLTLSHFFLCHPYFSLFRIMAVLQVCWCDLCSSLLLAVMGTTHLMHNIVDPCSHKYTHTHSFSFWDSYPLWSLSCKVM